MDAIDRRMAEVNARLAREKAARSGLLSDEYWKPSVDYRGQPAPGVVMSLCGRYTIVEIAGSAGAPSRFHAFRRLGPPELPKWSPPQWSQVFDDIGAARRGCQLHAGGSGS